MKIGQDFIRNITNINTGNSGVSLFEKGMTFSGRVMSMEGMMMEILIQGGTRIRALARLSVDLPLDTPLTFEVIENSENTLVLRPVLTDGGKSASKEEMITGFLTGMGLKPSAENIKFIKEQSYIFSDSMRNAVAAAGGDDEALKAAAFNMENLTEYINEFEQDEGMGLLNKLSALIIEIKRSGNSTKPLLNALSNLLKGLFVQSSMKYPVAFIPVPLYFENKLYNGEIFIESREENQGKKAAYAYIFADTPSGRVEALIKDVDGYIDLKIYCQNELMPFFNGRYPEVKKIISGIGLNLKSINVQELKHRGNFLDIVQKYIKPFTPLDVKV